MIDIGKMQRKATKPNNIINVDEYIDTYGDLAIIDGFRWQNTKKYDEQLIFHTQKDCWIWGAGYNVDNKDNPQSLRNQYKEFDAEEINAAYEANPQVWRLYKQIKLKTGTNYRQTDFLGSAAKVALLEEEEKANGAGQSDGTEGDGVAKPDADEKGGGVAQ